MKPTLLPGDLMPGFQFADAAGAPIELSGAALAGRPMALCAVADPSAAVAELQGFMDMTPAFADAGVGLLAVMRAGVAPPDGLESLTDALGTLMQILGLDASAPCKTVVLRANLHVAGVLDGPGQAARALDLARQHATAPTVITRQAPVLLVDEVIPAAFCDRLIALWDAGEKAEDVIGTSGGAAVKRATKKRTDHAIADPQIAQQLQFYFGRRLLPELAKAFQFRTLSTESFRIGCYDAAAGGGYFRPHRDISEQIQRRRYAVSVNLNTGEFEGGQVRFPEFGPQLYLPSRGGALVFSCSLLHEALPVTRGRRFVLLDFFSGEQMPEGCPWQRLGDSMWHSLEPGFPDAV